MNPNALHDILSEAGCEIHSVKDAPGGKKQYKKASKDEFVDTANYVKEIGNVSEMLKDKSFDERYAWIENTKNEGNKFYQEKNYGQALDKYLNALYGLNFKDQSIEMEKKVQFGLKVPILNNMAVCLLHLKEYRKVVAMTDQVLMIEPNNFKALCRRANALIELSNLTDAKDALTKAKKATSGQDDKKIVADLNVLYEKKAKQEQSFAKKVFEKPSNLYKEKKVQQPEMPAIDPLVDQDEVEYLKTIGHLHWFIYPYIKAVRNVLNCRRKPIPFKQEFGEQGEKVKVD